jgi:sucrose synthase
LSDLLHGYIRKDDITVFKSYIHQVFKTGSQIFLRQYLIDQYYAINENSLKKIDEKHKSLSNFIKKIQEAVRVDNDILIFYRPCIAKHQYFKFNLQKNHIKEITVSEYLEGKERYVIGRKVISHPLQIDFSPYHLYTPSVKNSKDIGKGFDILTGYIAENLRSRPKKFRNLLFDYLKTCKIDRRSILLNGDILINFQTFFDKVKGLLQILRKLKPETSYETIRETMKEYGFEAGWGDSASTIIKNLKVVKQLFMRPETADLDSFFFSLPVLSKIVITSPHGWFGQENVLGKPDTGGQVIYILDQVRELERVLKKHFAQSGMDIDPKIIVLTRLIPNAGNTACNQRLEKIHNTENGWILRVPFRDSAGKVVRDWISRFHVWRYLDRFAKESETELIEEFSGKPDLLIGNYSDGNIIASLLSEAFGTTLCTIAHALEKTKYLLSDLNWKDLEEQYHFSIHFTSDLLSINKSDFIICSTYQEIAGTEESLGQYESYQTFTLPEYYRVISGSDIRDPKYNINPPGVDENYYFPYYEQIKRDPSRTSYLEKRLFNNEYPDIYGSIKEPGKPSIFTMARLDKIKNLSGLVEAFCKNLELNEMANLIIAAGTIHIEESKDKEEKHEIRKIYDLVNKYKLDGNFRWLPSINKMETGEVYRIIADRRGIFVQPALFEGFGLTILEAMLSGLPTFGTMNGGPSEIIEDGHSGFLINPHDTTSLSNSLLTFLKKSKSNPAYWNNISRDGIKRVREHFSWSIYSKRLITMAKLYGFWKHCSSPKDRLISERYWDVLYHFLIKQRIEETSQV